MKVFRGLTMTGPAEAIEQMLRQIQESVNGDWMQDTASASQLEPALGGKPYCFIRSESKARKGATLWLLRRTPNEVSVLNIIPTGPGDLSIGEYNAILEEFAETFVQPCAHEEGVQVTLTEADVDIRKWVTQSTAERLRKFSTAANKSTGSRHPLDEERWFAFLASAHRDGSQLEPDLLARWLIEEEGWTADMAHQLAAEYERGRALLAFYDRAK